jgi:hypothetical protein
MAIGAFSFSFCGWDFYKWLSECFCSRFVVRTSHVLTNGGKFRRLQYHDF